jgi:hypothetical protein
MVFVIAIPVNSRVSFGFALRGSELGSYTSLVLGADAAPSTTGSATSARS